MSNYSFYALFYTPSIENHVVRILVTTTAYCDSIEHDPKDIQEQIVRLDYLRQAMARSLSDNVEEEGSELAEVERSEEVQDEETETPIVPSIEPLRKSSRNKNKQID